MVSVMEGEGRDAADAEVLAALASFVEHTDDLVGVADAWGRVLYLNPAARKRLGVGGAEPLTLADIFPAEAFGVFYETARPELLRRGSWSGEVVAKVAGSGTVRLRVSATASLGPGGENRGAVLIGREVTPIDALGADDEIPDEIPDEVPGALSREVFTERVASGLAAARRGGDSCAVLLCDVANAGELANRFGSEIVEQVMRAMTARLTRLARTSDSVGALSEHQLALLLRGIRGRRDALRIAQVVETELSERPIETTVGPLAIDVRWGIAVSAGDHDPAELVREAAFVPPDTDVTGVAARVDAPGAADPVSTGRPTVEELQLAFSHGELRAYAQPVIEPSSRALVGYRGFAQWDRDALGAVSASTVADITANTGLATVLDLYVARETAALLVCLTRDTPLAQYTPASERLLLDVHTEQLLNEIAMAYFLTSHQLHLAVDASLVAGASRQLRDALRSLADADISLVLAGLQDADVDTDELHLMGFRALELSPRLTHDLAIDQSTRRAVSELADHAHRAQLLVYAGGVGTKDEHDAIVELGVDLATGDLYAPARPTEQLADD